jgi:hypothetical protein
VALRSFQPHGVEAITALAPHPPYFGLSTAGNRVSAIPLPPYDGTADEAQVHLAFLFNVHVLLCARALFAEGIEHDKVCQTALGPSEVCLVLVSLHMERHQRRWIPSHVGALSSRSRHDHAFAFRGSRVVPFCL